MLSKILTKLGIETKSVFHQTIFVVIRKNIICKDMKPRRKLTFCKVLIFLYTCKLTHVGFFPSTIL